MCRQAAASHLCWCDARTAQATRGVKSGGAAGVAGGASLFALRDGLTEAQRQELAWATFAILRNTNACGVLAVKRGVAWCVLPARLAVPIHFGHETVTSDSHEVRGSYCTTRDEQTKQLPAPPPARTPASPPPPATPASAPLWSRAPRNTELSFTLCGCPGPRPPASRSHFHHSLVGGTSIGESGCK